MGSQEDATGLDPRRNSVVFTNAVVCNIYEQILRMDAYGNVVPGLAKEWELSQDGKELTLHIVTGAKYHNGEPVTAEDVVFTIKDMQTCAYSSSNFAFIDRAEVVDEATVKVYFKYAYGPALKLFTTKSGIVKESFMANGEDSLARAPIGCGPYEFVEWINGDKIVLKAFDGYFGEAPSIKNIIYKIIPDSTTGAVALEKGEVDIYLNTADADLPTLEANPNLKVLLHSIGKWQFIQINTTKPPLDNMKVRQAIAMAIDRESLIIGAAEGNGDPTYSFTPEGYPGHIPGVEINKYDVEKAKALLAEAGYPNGFSGISFTVMPRYSVTAQCLQADLRKIGIIADIEIVEGGSFWSVMEKGEFYMSSYGWNVISLDPDVALDRIYRSTQVMAGNYTRYNNPRVDEIFDLGKVEPDQAKRDTLYKELVEITLTEAAYVPLYWSLKSIAFNKDLEIPRIPLAEAFFVPSMIRWK